jgi:broad specificity phosphatase PhoE
MTADFLHTLTLVRHGATASTEARVLEGHSMTSLSQTGAAQARALAKYLARRNGTAIYSGTAPRARETADVIANACGLRRIDTAGLNERNFGPYEGLRRSDLLDTRRQNKLGVVDPVHDWVGVADVETDESIWLRLKPIISDILYRPTGGHAILVTHAGVIKAALHKIFGIPSTRVRCFYITPGSAVTLQTVDSCLEMTEFWVNNSDPDHCQ